MIATLLIGGFLVLLLVGIPVVWAMGAAVILTLWVSHLSLPLAWFAQQLVRGADSITLSAIPLFLLAGGVMNHGGLTHRIVGVAESIFGRLRGGLGLANVATCLVYGGISGSATADTGAVASIMIPAMEARGYPRDFSAGVTAAAGTLGIIVPPSVVMIMYGVVTNTSIGGMFVAGILPGLLVCGAFMIVAYVTGVRRGFPRLERTVTIWSFSKDLLGSAPALMMPLLVLGSIVGGFATATEAAALALVYALLIGSLVYRGLSWATLPGILVDSLATTGAIMMVMAVAAPFAWILTVEQLPMLAAAWITGLHTSPFVTILLILAVLKIVGFWLDLGPALIILAPILQPIALSAGFGQYQVGLLFIVTLGIGLFTPPIGTNIFVVCNVAKIDMWAVSRQLVPYWAAAIVCIVLMTFISQITQWLPELLSL